MNSRLLVAVASAALLLGASQASAQSADAGAVHRNALVLDGHADILLPSTPARYYLPGGGSRADLDHLTRGGVDAVVLSLAVGPGPRDAAGIAAAHADLEAKLGRIRAFAVENPGRVGIALTADDVTRLAGEGKVAVIIGFQNARSIGDDLSQIDALYADGVRVFAFNHAGHNSWSDSSRPSAGEPTAEHNGLSPIGRQAVARLNDLGVLIDVSQLSTPALLQTLELTRAPVAATPFERPSPDREHPEPVPRRAGCDQGQWRGGATDAVQQLSGRAECGRARADRRHPGSARLIRHVRIAERRLRHAGGRTAAGLPRRLGARSAARDGRRLCRPIDYIAKRIGWDHVGIGTDFDHGAGITGFDSEADAPNVTAELLRRGYTPEQVEAIWSGNFLRVLRAAQSGRST